MYSVRIFCQSHHSQILGIVRAGEKDKFPLFKRYEFVFYAAEIEIVIG